MIPLIEEGVVTNKYKEINEKKIVCTTLTGTKELYQYAHENKGIELYPAEYTHNSTVIIEISNFHAIHFALEVNIWGNVNGELVDVYPIGGVGEQMDFIKGARLSKGGKTIIALPSTAKKRGQNHG